MPPEDDPVLAKPWLLDASPVVPPYPVPYFDDPWSRSIAVPFDRSDLTLAMPIRHHDIGAVSDGSLSQP